MDELKAKDIAIEFLANNLELYKIYRNTLYKAYLRELEHNDPIFHNDITNQYVEELSTHIYRDMCSRASIVDFTLYLIMSRELALQIA